MKMIKVRKTPEIRTAKTSIINTSLQILQKVRISIVKSSYFGNWMGESLG